MCSWNWILWKALGEVFRHRLVLVRRVFQNPKPETQNPKPQTLQKVLDPHHSCPGTYPGGLHHACHRVCTLQPLYHTTDVHAACRKSITHSVSRPNAYIPAPSQTNEPNYGWVADVALVFLLLLPLLLIPDHTNLNLIKPNQYVHDGVRALRRHIHACNGWLAACRSTAGGQGAASGRVCTGPRGLHHVCRQ